MPPITSSSVLIGMQMLRRNPMRTFLSALGVIIGVGSLMAILNLGDSLEKYSRDQIERTTDLQLIEVAPQTNDRVDGILIAKANAVTFGLGDVDSLAARLNGGALVTLSVVGSQWVGLEGDTSKYPSLVMATTPDADKVFLRTIKSGRFLGSDDMAGNGEVLVLSHRLGEKIARGTDVSSVVGKEALVGIQRMRILGVLEGLKDEQTSLAYVPFASRVGSSMVKDGLKYPRILIKVLKIEDFDQIYQQVRSWLEQRYGTVDNQFSITNPKQRHEQIRQSMLVFKLIMGCITGISLIVGGIGIMNVLLASVSERTREIGIRRAAGARKSDVLIQFLVESVSISGLGGCFGVILGYLVTVIALAVIRNTTSAPIEAATSVGSILVAFSAAFVVGIVFGIYPAVRAARLSPTDAIRYE
jgi:putative ABC transport system permease protein